MSFEPRTTTNTGALALDAGEAFPKGDRLKITMAAALVTREKDAGGGALTIKQLAEPGNALFWRHDPLRLAPRGAWGSWSFAMPARYEQVDPNAIEGSTRALWPLEHAAATDRDFAGLFEPHELGIDPALSRERGNGFRWMVNGYGRPDAIMPEGTEAIVMSTTGHGTREVVAAPVGGPLVAAISEPRSSRHVLNEFGERGPLHSLLRVVPVPLDPTATVAGAGPDAYVPALNLGGGALEATIPHGVAFDRTPADGGSTGAHAAAYLGASQGGPLHVGHYDDKHRQAFVERDDHALGTLGGGSSRTLPWNLAGLATHAIWYRDRERSASLDFSPYLYNDAWEDVLLVYDPRAGHTINGRAYPGLWRWQVPRTYSPPMGPPEARVAPPRGNGPPGQPPINVNVNVNNWWWRINVNVRLRPGPGRPLDPARHPHEVAYKSQYGQGIRRPGTQPYDGRFGGAPADKGDERPDDGLHPGAPQQDLHPFDPSGFSDLIGGTGSTGGASVGELRSINDEILTGGAPWVQAPLCWHVQSIAAISDRGDPVATIRAGDYYRTATTDGVWYFGPPEAIVDLASNPPDVSKATLGLYDGYQGGDAARLAWGTPDHATGALFGGPYFDLSGSVGSRNLVLGFRDSSGSARAGTLSLSGHLVPGADDTYDLGESSTPAAWRRLYIGKGSDAAPSISFGGQTNLGFYWLQADRVGLASGGVRVGAIQPGGISAKAFSPSSHAGAVLNSPVFSSSYLRLDPSHSIQWASTVNGGGAAVDLWLQRAAAGVLKIGAGLGSGTSWGTLQAALAATDGSVSAPSIGFKDDTDCGGYRIGADQIGFVVGGSLGAGNYGAVRLTTALFGPVGAGAQLDLGAASAPWKDGHFSGDVSIGGKLTVTGLIDPTGLQLDQVATNPGTSDTLWSDSGATSGRAAGTLVWGDTPIRLEGADRFTVVAESISYTPDDQSAAYTGAADGEAKLADLNALRAAYENLRAAVESLIGTDGAGGIVIGGLLAAAIAVGQVDIDAGV